MGREHFFNGVRIIQSMKESKEAIVTRDVQILNFLLQEARMRYITSEYVKGSEATEHLKCAEDTIKEELGVIFKTISEPMNRTFFPPSYYNDGTLPIEDYPNNNGVSLKSLNEAMASLRISTDLYKVQGDSYRQLERWFMAMESIDGSEDQRNSAGVPLLNFDQFEVLFYNFSSVGATTGRRFAFSGGESSEEDGFAEEVFVGLRLLFHDTAFLHVDEDKLENSDDEETRGVDSSAEEDNRGIAVVSMQQFRTWLHGLEPPVSTREVQMLGQRIMGTGHRHARYVTLGSVVDWALLTLAQHRQQV